MIWSTSRIQNLLIAPALVFAAACQSSGPSEFPDQNRSLHGELQVFIDSATDVEILPRNSIAILESLIDGSYDGQTVVGVQEFTGSIEAVESFRKENIKKQTTRIRSLWRTVSSGKKSRIKLIKKTDPAKAAKQGAKLDREEALFAQVEDSVDPILTQLEEIEDALNTVRLVAELDFSPAALQDLAPDVVKIEGMISALQPPAAATIARAEEFQTEFEPYLFEPVDAAPAGEIDEVDPDAVEPDAVDPSAATTTAE